MLKLNKTIFKVLNVFINVFLTIQCDMYYFYPHITDEGYDLKAKNAHE